MKRNVPAGEEVGIWAFNPVAVYLSGRPSAGRAFGWPLVVGARTEYGMRLRRELMAALERNPPRAFMVDTVWEQSWTEDASLETFPELNKFLSERYVEAHAAGGLRLLALREPQRRLGL